MYIKRNKGGDSVDVRTFYVFMFLFVYVFMFLFVYILLRLPISLLSCRHFVEPWVRYCASPPVDQKQNGVYGV